jgi:4-methyl-5(b-hydroxyethyl)-thiazole monophosphate biosynthesis
MARVLVPLATGFEELEAITIIDLLRRAGVEVISAGLDDQPGAAVTASRGTVHIPDQPLAEALQLRYDMIVLPGGLPGADHLRDDARLAALLQRTAAEGGYTAAICAAPKALAAAGLLAGKRATAYPGVLQALDLPDTELSEDAVVQDGRVITSKGPGTAMDFSLRLITLLCGEAVHNAVLAGLQRG